MWDSNALLQLLKSMPKKLSKENLEKIQMLIDADSLTKHGYATTGI